MFELQRNKRKRVGMRQFKCWIYLSWTKHLPWTALDEWIYYKKEKLFPLCPPRCQRWKYGVNCIYYESLNFFFRLFNCMWWSSLHTFLHPAVQIYEIHIFIITSSSFPGIRQLHISHNTPYLPPKFCVIIVFNFSWDGCNTLASEQQTYFQSSLLSSSEGEKRRPEIRLLFAG